MVEAEGGVAALEQLLQQEAALQQVKALQQQMQQQKQAALQQVQAHEQQLQQLSQRSQALQQPAEEQRAGAGAAHGGLQAALAAAQEDNSQQAAQGGLQAALAAAQEHNRQLVASLNKEQLSSAGLAAQVRIYCMQRCCQLVTNVWCCVCVS
jgi:hypothetical protein